MRNIEYAAIAMSEYQSILMVCKVLESVNMAIKVLLSEKEKQ